MEKLRVAIVANALDGLQNWEGRLFDKICCDERFVLVGVILPANSTQLPKKTSVAAAIFSGVTALEARIYTDMPETGSNVDHAALPDVPVIAVSLMSPGGTEIDDASSSAVAALQPDLILQHGPSSLARAMANKASFGVWALGHATDASDDAHMVGFWEAYRRRPTTPARLFQVASDPEQDILIAEAHFNTDPIPSRNRAYLGDRSVSLVLREMVRLAETRRAPHPIRDVANENKPESLALRHAIGFTTVFVSSLYATIVARLLRKMGRKKYKWTLFFGATPFNEATLKLATECRPPPGEFWADPFLLERNGETYVFYENYVYAFGLGRISVGRYRDSKLEVLGDALVLPYHLSFPYLVECQDELFMIPESCAARRVEVWRCTKFPLEWELYSVGLEGESVADTVLFEDEGQWWMFANISSGMHEDQCNELHVFSIDGPALKTVVPHPLNPVVIDSRVARNAGRIRRKDGQLIRPSQNSSHGVYGWGLNLMEITRLDMEGYEERCLVQFGPDQLGVAAFHHVDSLGDTFVVDGCRKWS
jgi:hypothetical protein